MGFDYAAELYEHVFRRLVKNIAKQYPDNSQDTLKSEIEYIRKELRNVGLDSLFQEVLNKDTYYRWVCHSKVNGNKRVKNQMYHSEIDFSTIHKKYKKDIDIVWILTKSICKYPEESMIQEDNEDRDSNRQFRQLLEQLGFSDEEKQIFSYSDKAFYFNALEDNGDIIYEQLKQDLVMYNHFVARNMEEKVTYIFLKALPKNNLSTMRKKLRDLLNLCYKTRKSNSIQEMGVQDIIKVAECLSDLVPVIDQNSKLKRIERLREEQGAVRFAVFKKLLMGSKCSEGDTRYEYLEKVVMEHFRDHIVVKELFGTVCNEKESGQKEFNEDQILVICGEYFELLGQNLEWFKYKVERYQEVCDALPQGESSSIQKYRDLWEKVWMEGCENE